MLTWSNQSNTFIYSLTRGLVFWSGLMSQMSQMRPFFKGFPCLELGLQACQHKWILDWFHLKECVLCVSYSVSHTMFANWPFSLMIYSFHLFSSTWFSSKNSFTQFFLHFHLESSSDIFHMSCLLHALHFRRFKSGLKYLFGVKKETKRGAKCQGRWGGSGWRRFCD